METVDLNPEEKRQQPKEDCVRGGFELCEMLIIAQT